MTPAVVVVPDRRGQEAFAGVPLVDPVVWDLTGPAPAGAEQAEVLVTRKSGLECGAGLAALPRLRMVQLFSSGRDGWQGSTPAGVTVSGADRAHGGAVSEWVLAQLLRHYRDLDGYRSKQRAQHWQAHRTGTLAGKRVLVLGAGDIAENLRRRIEPFGAELTMSGRTARPGVLDLAAALSTLPEQDVVVLALPLTAETRGLVDARFLAAMADGAVLVNAGRGPLVDTDALLAELTAQRLHAVLDVTDPEPLPPGHPLWTAPGAVITPHSAGITEDTSDRCWTSIVRNVSEFVQSPMRGMQ